MSLGYRDMGHLTYPRLKDTGDHRMSGKRGRKHVSCNRVPQDPRGMVKARLLEVQSRSGQSQPRCYADSTQRHHVPPPARLGDGWAMADGKSARWDTRGYTLGVGMSGRPNPCYYV